MKRRTLSKQSSSVRVLFVHLLISYLDWKSEEFNIFVMKSSRNILASYMKENSKLEISITVPDDYPLS